MTYKLLTGPYAGEIVPEGFNLGKFDSLDEDMKSRVRDFGEQKYGLQGERASFPVNLDDLAQEYCNSWQDEETEEEVTLS